jgi:hypothetical protein
MISVAVTLVLAPGLRPGRTRIRGDRQIASDATAVMVKARRRVPVSWLPGPPR